MENTELKIKNILTELKTDFDAISLKAEFEDEGSTFEEVQLLKKFADDCNLDLTIKIGGCGALNDINFCNKLYSNTIVAPMIESPYAAKKFVSKVKETYGEKIPELFVNIETITGVNNLEHIFNSEDSNFLSGIVVGKCDLAHSLGLCGKDVNGSYIFSMVEDISKLCKLYNKNLIVGGGISNESLDFLKSLGIENIHRFETRKVIFDAKNTLQYKPSEAIKKAMIFEILWIEYCAKVFNSPLNENRIFTLLKRLENFELCSV